MTLFENMPVSVTVDGVEHQILWPTKPSRLKEYALEEGQFVLRDIEPLDISNLKNNKFRQAYLASAKEILIDLVRQMEVPFRGTDAPLVCSAEIPPGTYFLDENAIYRNEDEAEGQAQDSDGDRICVKEYGATNQDDLRRVTQMLTEENRSKEEITSLRNAWLPFCTMGILNKAPLTDLDPPLVKLTSLPKEKFLPLPSQHKLNAILRREIVKNACSVENIAEGFKKTHSPNETGLKTNQLNLEGLIRATNGKSWLEKARMVHVNPEDPAERRRVIEWEGLKGISKDGVEATAVTARSPEFVFLEDQFKWFFSPKSIGGLTWANWIFDEDLNMDKVVQKIRDISPSFALAERAKPRPTKAFEDTGLWNRLRNLGLIGCQEVPGQEGLPPCLLLWLSRPDQMYCGMTSVKRSIADSSFAFLLPPVAMKVGNKFEILHPKEALQRLLAKFDSQVVNPTTGEVVRLFPKSLTDFDRIHSKRVSLQSFFEGLCGELGDTCPALWDEKGHINPSIMAKSIVKRTIAVVFTGESLEEKRYEAEAVNKLVPIVLPSGKGNSRRIRKFALAGSHGKPLWADETDSGRRSGNLRAQLIRALPPKEYTVAYVQMTTKSVPQITPSGVLKQQIRDEEVFLPRISLTPTNEEGEEFTPHVYTKWSGEKALVFQSSAKNCCLVGKLIDRHGMKFVPRASGVDQARTLEGEPIDLLIPIDEIIVKSCSNSHLRNATRTNIIVDGKKVEAYLGKHQFHRTGVASENIPVRKTTRHMRGVDSIGILVLISRFENACFPCPDLSYFNAKVKAVQKLAKLTGL